jgi:ribokinase
MRAAVVGHVEWIEFVPVERVPRAGEIIGADESWAEAAGGGAVAAVQFSKLADSVHFFTALGADELGRRAKVELEEQGIEVHASLVDSPQRRGFTYLDEGGERTITVIGPKVGARGNDVSLPWFELARCDAVYFCAGDADALRNARRARVLVATARELGTLKRGAVELDALVGSGNDEADLGRARRLGAAWRPVHRRAARRPIRRRLRRGRLLRRGARVRARVRARDRSRARVRVTLRRGGTHGAGRARGRGPAGGASSRVAAIRDPCEGETV